MKKSIFIVAFFFIAIIITSCSKAVEVERREAVAKYHLYIPPRFIKAGKNNIFMPAQNSYYIEDYVVYEYYDKTTNECKGAKGEFKTNRKISRREYENSELPTREEYRKVYGIGVENGRGR